MRLNDTNNLGRSIVELQTEHTWQIAMGRKEQERRKLKRAAVNYHLMKIRKQGLAMIHTHYGKVINKEESMDVFAHLDTRKLEHKTFL